MADEKKPQKILPGDGSSWNTFLVFISFLILFFVMQSFFTKSDVKSVTYNEFLDYVNQGKVEEVTISDNLIQGKLKEEGKGKKGESFSTVPVKDDKLVSLLYEKGVKFSGEQQHTFWLSLLGWFLPLIIIIVFWLFMFGRMSGTAQGGLMSLGKSRAKVYVEKDTKTTFKDVAGVDEAIEELREVVSFLKEPFRYSRLGGHTPRGVLLVGPPGTGKTLLARAVAGEASVPFFSINGSEFVEMFVGLGAARVRDLFEQARKEAPCILFIDELDALGKARGIGYIGSGANDEKEQTLNQLLAELDGFDSSPGIILLSATNRPEILDPALLRAGRFDRQILVDKPDQNGREQILDIHTRKVKLASDVNLRHIASLTPGFSGAELMNLVNEAALIATRRDAIAITESDLTFAIERIVAGLERKKRLITPEEKKRVAYHEMGHATVALSIKAPDRVHKISIIPRGVGALGYTMQRPTEDRYLITRGELKVRLAVLLGGRVSEQIFFDEVSTGAGDDLNKATNIARAMVTQYGMSEKLGLSTYEQQEHPFLQGPMQMPQQRHYSEETSLLIDSEIKRYLEEGRALADKVIRDNREFVESGVRHLLEEETLEEVDIKDLWAKHGTYTSLNGNGNVV